MQTGSMRIEYASMCSEDRPINKLVSPIICCGRVIVWSHTHTTPMHCGCQHTKSMFTEQWKWFKWLGKLPFTVQEVTGVERNTKLSIVQYLEGGCLCYTGFALSGPLLSFPSTTAACGACSSLAHPCPHLCWQKWKESTDKREGGREREEEGGKEGGREGGRGGRFTL